MILTRAFVPSPVVVCDAASDDNNDYNYDDVSYADSRFHMIVVLGVWWPHDDHH